jgi:hypothetical protein
MPVIKNLTYPARSAAQTEALKNRIADINDGFKLSGIIPRLGLKGNSLILRYKDTNGKSKEISPRGVDISPPGIVEAQNVAAKISQAIRLGNYSDEWLELEIYRTVEKVVKAVLLAGTVRDDFASKWLKYRSGDRESSTRQKKATLYRYEAKLKRLYKLAEVDDDRPFDRELIDELMNLHSEGTDLRFRAKETLSIVCTVFGVVYSFRGIGKRVKSKPRDIPTDAEIEIGYHKFDNISGRFELPSKEFYQWCYGLISTYGLRPQEIFAIDMAKSFQSATHNWLFLDGSLCEGIKTGDRVIPPLHPKWVELFDLAVPKYIDSLSTDVTNKANQINRFWLRHQIGCRPYDLRHGYAIRGDKLGKTVVGMARAMGHDISTHVKIYQKWISIADQIESFHRQT